MADLSALELEVAHVIVDALNLEDVRAESIGPEDPLFRDGLGLDSIDALELVVMMEKEFGVIVEEMEVAREAFASVRSLSTFVANNQPV